MQVKFREVVMALMDRFPPGAVRSTDHPCVFRVKTATGTFSFNKKAKYETRFVDELVEQLPFVLVWLGEPPRQEVRRYLQSQVTSNDSAAFWTTPGATSMQRL